MGAAQATNHHSNLINGDRGDDQSADSDTGKSTSSRTTPTSTDPPKKTLKQQTDKKTENNRPKVTLPYYMEPTFYIGGGNGVALVEDVCTNLGWKRIKEKSDDSYKLRWCELKTMINFNTFREGDQLVNRIPNCHLLTNKLGLVNSLQEFDRMAVAYKRRTIKLDFIPETFKLDDPREREAFRNQFKVGETYICKPTGRNQGKGIFLVKTEEEVKKIFEEQEGRTSEGKPVKPLNRIIQRYIHNPLLLKKKKFDLRCYMLIASTVPYLVVYHKGYVRLSLHDYDNDSDNLIVHLTNQFIQKKDAAYKEDKEETTWSMDKFNEYINENVMPDKENVEKDWVYNVLTPRMKQIMTYCFNAVKHKLACKIGYFDLYGFDFMVDEDMKIWLIEINVNPCLATNCEALREVIPGVVKETIHLALECFEKSRKGRPLLPLQALNEFEVLVNSCPKSGNPGSKPMRSKSISPGVARRAQTKSPTKEPTIVSASIDVTRMENNGGSQPKYNFQYGRSSTIISRKQGSNIPKATATSVGDNTVEELDETDTQIKSKPSSAVDSDSGNKKSAQKNEQLKNKTQNNNANNALKLTTFKMPEDANDESKRLVTQSDKSPFGTTSKGKGLCIPRQSAEMRLRQSNGSKKLQYTNLKREPTITVQITRESTKIPSETKIVIVDHQTQREIEKDDSRIRRSVYINSSSMDNKRNGTPEKKDTAENFEISEKSDKTRVRTPYGAGGDTDSMIPVDTVPAKSTARYAVFPLSPYKQPVAQLKLSHKAKKSRPRPNDEIGNRGS